MGSSSSRSLTFTKISFILVNRGVGKDTKRVSICSLPIFVKMSFIFVKSGVGIHAKCGDVNLTRLGIGPQITLSWLTVALQAITSIIMNDDYFFTNSSSILPFRNMN